MHDSYKTRYYCVCECVCVCVFESSRPEGDLVDGRGRPEGD